MKPAALKLFLFAGAAEGLAALVWLLWGRSMERNALFLGYSANRLALALAVLAPLGLLTGAAFSAARRPDRLARAAAWLDARLLDRDRPVLPLLACLLAAAGGALFLLLTARLPSPGLDAFLAQFSTRLPLLLERLTPVIARARPVLLWLALLAAQTAALLLAAYPAAYREKLRSGALAYALLAVLILLAAAAHLLVLAFRLKTLLVIPGWKWYFHDKPLTPGGLALFGALLLLTLLLAFLLLRAPAPSARRWLPVLLLLGAAWQIAFGLIEGGGFETLRRKYADSVFNNYAEAAAQQPGWLRPLREYEDLYAGDWYLGTKPPGVLLAYIVVDKLSNLVAPDAAPQARFLRLTSFSAYVFPFLSMLVLFPLHRLARWLTGEPGALLPGLLYLTVPSVILIPLFLDQALYPLLFALVLLLALAVIQRRSYGLAFLAGLSIYAALYFSFSLLPLLPLAGLWLALDGWMQRKTFPLRRTLLLLLALAAGALAGLLLFRLALNYDILLRYTRAMAQHQRAKDFRPGLAVLLEAVQLNNAEFVTWSGPALILLFLSALPVYLRRPTRAGGLLLAFLLTYLALNLLGQTHGEVQRLWIFLLPPVCLYAAPQTRKLFPRAFPGVALALTLQLLTALLTYAFQDFYG